MQELVGEVKGRRKGYGLWRSLDPEWLREKVVVERQTQASVAVLAGVSLNVIKSALREYGIRAPTRRRERIEIDPEWLRRKYVDERLSMVSIAELVGCSNPTVSKHLHRHGIPVRSSHQSGENDQCRPWHNREWLVEMYYGQDLTQQEIANLCGCHLQTIVKAMRRHGIEGRQAGRRGQRCDGGQADVAQVCWNCPFREDCLDWPVEAPCRLLVEDGACRGD